MHGVASDPLPSSNWSNKNKSEGSLRPHIFLFVIVAWPLRLLLHAEEESESSCSWQRKCFAANMKKCHPCGSSFDIRNKDKEVVDESHLITIHRETTGSCECIIMKLRYSANKYFKSFLKKSKKSHAPFVILPLPSAVMIEISIIICLQ